MVAETRQAYGRSPGADHPAPRVLSARTTSSEQGSRDMTPLPLVMTKLHAPPRREQTLIEIDDMVE